MQKMTSAARYDRRWRRDVMRVIKGVMVSIMTRRQTTAGLVFLFRELFEFSKILLRFVGFPKFVADAGGVIVSRGQVGVELYGITKVLQSGFGIPDFSSSTPISNKDCALWGLIARACVKYGLASGARSL